MNHILKATILFTLLLVVGCSSSEKKMVNEVEIGKDEVLSRMNDAKERPLWADESTPLVFKDSYVYSIGSTTLDGDSRVEAGFRIAENNAKATLSSSIEQRLDFLFQNAEEGTDINSTQARYIGAEASKLTVNSLMSEKRYWERIATSQTNGQRTIVYKVFAQVKMKESDFKKAILDSIKKQQGKENISKDFAEKVNQHWDQFVSGAN